MSIIFPARWLRFEHPDIVVVYSGKVELGQGLSSVFPQLAAHELYIDIEQIKWVSGDTRYCPDEGVTAGSLSVEVGGGALRHACAAAREQFRQVAAHRLGIDAQTITIENGYFRGVDPSKRYSYWDLAGDVDLLKPVDNSEIALRAACLESPLGKPIHRPDLMKKLSTKGFIQDMQLPGMLHCRVIRPQAPRAQLLSCDETALLALDGVVKLIRNGSFLAVACFREEHAIQAAEKAARHCVWQEVELPPMEAIYGELDAQPAEIRSVISTGQSNLPESIQILERRYSRPFLAHASIGPSCALAWELDGLLKIWSHTQSPFLLQKEIATVLGRKLDSIAVIHQPGAGCYGHNGADDVALDAALIATSIGQPVRVVWSRRDELSWAPLGAAMSVTLRAGVTAAGRITHWETNIYSFSHVNRPGSGDGINLLAAQHIDPPFATSTPRDFPPPAGGGDRNAIPIYDLSHCDVSYHFLPHSPFRTSAIRSLGAFANVFSIESMMDDLALACGMDPLDFRLMHLSDSRSRAVLNAAAHRFGWSETSTTKNAAVCYGKGIGFGRYKNSAAYFAVIVDLEMAECLRVCRAVAAVDAGLVVNPDGLVNQIEGGIIQAISWTLIESVRWNREGLLLDGWEEYPILGFDQIPEIDVVILNQPHLPSLGVGECAAGPTAGAIGNALFAGLGVRATSLPLTPQAIAQAME